MEQLIHKIWGGSAVRKGIVMMIISMIMTIPWLGLTDYNTKGEPREAVVSLSILQKDNWVLPVNNDIDIPYKPMMYHWTGTITSFLNGGTPNEMTSRLPSALALSLLVGLTCWFYCRYSGRYKVAILTAGVMLTCFELHRSGVSARVDMTLTMWMVASFYLLYRWWKREKESSGRRLLYRVPWLAILCMSAAMLSKGPVGVVLPCLASGIFMLLKKERFLTSFLWMVLFGILSLIIPLIWYYMAWQQGGEEFLKLVMEENFGRMTGTMTYESHDNPWHYNIWITLVGFLPWTLLALFGLIVIIVRKRVKSFRFKNLKIKLTDIDLFSLVSLLTILIFFCVPSSKRSVYLMPAYPFIAWFAAKFFMWLGKQGYSGAIRMYGSILAGTGIIIELIFLVIRLMPAGTITFSGRSAAANYAMLDGIRSGGMLIWLLTGILFASGVAWFVWKNKLSRPNKMLAAIFGILFCYFVTLDGGFQPLLLNQKSLKADAFEIEKIIGDAPIYEFIEFGESSDVNKYHFFELNFYLGDRMQNFIRRQPAKGYLAIPTGDVSHWLKEFEKSGYEFNQVYRIDRPARKEKIDIYRFERVPMSESVFF